MCGAAEARVMHVRRMTIEETARQLTDATVALGAVTSPWWVQFVDQSFHWATALGGLVVIGFQVAAQVDRYKRRRQRRSK
jgi:hypothetical protein